MGKTPNDPIREGPEVDRACYVYILCCADKTLYTGWTYDLDLRLEQHNSGQGAKYTRGRGPLELIYKERCDSKSDALKREYAIKQMTRPMKERLIAEAGPSV